jgi:hypothetical protein
LTQTVDAPIATWLEPQHLPSTLRRYLAQELLDELRHPKWRIVAIDDDYTPSRGHPKDKPAGRGPAGQGISDPLGALYAMRFTVEKVWELDIYHNHYVLLEALAYERWEKRHITGHAVVLERLLGNRRTVFEQALRGYGTSKGACIRLRGEKVEAEALESLFDICRVARLP